MIFALLIATGLGGGFIGYQVGAMLGWRSGFRRRDALAKEFQSALLSIERELGWRRGRRGWETPDCESVEARKPELFS